MAVVTMREMLDAGVHFGHQTSRWNPKMKRFILTERNGNYIIDLQQSLAKIDAAYEFVRETVAHGGTVLFVGTKRQAQSTIAEQAARVGMPYVNERWLGGMLTNFQTVSKRVARLKELEEVDFDDVAGSGHTKKELLILRREKDKLSKVLSGIRDMSKTPSIVWIVDTNKEHLAVDEAKKLGIPIVGILDSNCDPDSVQYGIPGNDDAIRSVGLLTRVISDAIAEGIKQRHAVKAGDGAEPTAATEPLAEWEQELLDGAEKAEEKTADAPTEGVSDTDIVAKTAQPIMDEAETSEVLAAVDGDDTTAQTVKPAQKKAAEGVPAPAAAKKAAAAADKAAKNPEAEEAVSTDADKKPAAENVPDTEKKAAAKPATKKPAAAKADEK
ncbi:30S ribosomal protein S2 [Demequina sp. TTPB684]|uniref:30S ribosomal protein S2 n=1 Tax=unclassified Demequina TaxID=2620311 RepID=UPI001CF25B1F|nr:MULTISPECIES: 30S ribosomal protein S2 [unclassified Demequina]MCB2412158.1 30S ribosomal protein S2 [Demequina sp. TTPB684]UPU89649.1 30S ribosomal protein S2 [Demequina sp. TMPB413]